MQLNSAYQRIIEKLKVIGITPADTIELKNTKNQLVFLAVLMSFGGIMWGTILVAFGIYLPSVIPYGYVVLSFFNLLSFHILKKFSFTRAFQIVISMLLPFALQWSLGGFIASGIIMLWATLALIGSITLLKGKGTYLWLCLFITLTAFSLYIDPYIAHLRPAIFTSNVSLVLVAVNMLTIISIIFILAKVKVDQDLMVKRELAETNDELLVSNDALQQIQEEISAQRDILEQNNKELKDYQQRIISSIESAKTIQKAFLPTNNKVHNLFGEHFILYMPRDVVSGDFYWAHQFGNKRIFIEGDCTGHGVPGAFMTLISNAILNQIIQVENTYDPAEIMEKSLQKLEYVLQQKITNNRDGLDISIVVIEEEADDFKVTFGAANQNLYYSLSNEIKELRGTRKRIGGITNSKKQFESTELILPKDSILYLYSDGYVDQNNLQRKKFSSTRLKSLLTEINDLPMADQKRELYSALNIHRNGAEQRDDITVIGLKLTPIDAVEKVLEEEVDMVNF